MGGYEGTNLVAAGDDKLKGIGGWLLATSIILLILSAANIIIAYFLIFFGFQLMPQNSSWTNMIISLYSIFLILEIIAFIASAAMLLSKSSGATKIAKLSLKLAIIARLVLIGIAPLPVLFSQDLPLYLAGILLLLLTWHAVTIPIVVEIPIYFYLLKSRRVAATFPTDKPPAALTADDEDYIDPDEDVVMRYLK